jgi:ubiquinol-cytochrome c reductase cytochrome b subunit
MPVLQRIGDWFDERLSTRAIGEALFARKIPSGTGWLYTLGSVSLFLFLLQAATGMFLAMGYAPTPDHAYDSVRFVTEEAPFGAFVRGLHVWGASAMVIAVGLHLLRTFMTGSYKFPREATWMSGVLLLLVVLGFGFTGYLLPWNVKAYWATQVGTKIAEQAPIVGPALARVLRGGDELGTQTLTRFYALHVLLLPAALLALIGGHLFMVVRQGISAPPERQKASPVVSSATARRQVLEHYQAQKEQGASFYPYSLAKDAAAVLLVFAIVAAFAWWRPPEVGEIADPTDTGFNPRPEWYFLFLFQLLKYFPGSLESLAAVVFPSLAILALLLLPFVDWRLHRHPLDRPFATGLAVGAVGAVLFLTVTGARSPLLSAYVPTPPQVAAGARLFRQLHCENCHSVRGRGSAVGPDLALGPQVHDATWMKSHFGNPQTIVPGALRVASLLDDETQSLITYIEELRGGGPYSEQAPRQFRRYCSECHRLGEKGGDKGPDLSAIGDARNRSFIHRYIEDPKKILTNSRMPVFLAPDGPLTHQQIEDIARYLAAQRSVASNGEPKGGPQ